MKTATSSRTSPAPQRRVPAVTRAVAILRYLARTREPIGVVPLAREIDLIPSTCLHILRILTDEGLVSMNSSTKQYSIGAGVLSLASAFSILNPFVQIARRQLDDLSRTHSCAFAAIESCGPDHCIVVAIGDVHAGLSVRVTVGTRFPALVSATGLCFAAFGQLAPPALRRGFDQLKWDNPPAYAEWLEDIEKARSFGYAMDDGHYMRGVSIVAVPVFNNAGTLLGTLTAVGLREQFQGDRLQALIDNMRDIGREVNLEMGHETSFEPRPASFGSATLHRAARDRANKAG